LRLVAPRGIEGEIAEELAVLCEDPDVKIRDKVEDSTPGVASTQADVQQLTLVPQGDLP
jgi:hypothetical protein